MQATVILESRSPRIADGLTYAVPAGLHILPGMLVSVPLRSDSVNAVVVDIQEEISQQEEYSLKEIQSVLSAEPLLSPAHLQTAKWIASHYRCPLRHALRPFLPSSQWKPAKTKTDLDGSNSDDTCTLPQLSEAQETALQTILSSAKPALLFGITGSGKTEVYAHLIADAIQHKKQAIVLLPEILLTEHIIDRFRSIIDPKRIAVLHSKLTPAKRRDVWHAIRRGDKALVVGSRSALFAPCMHLGLVVIDEEHEWTYKNEQQPRYHAREVAKVLCKHSGARLVMGTATPSAESWHAAKDGNTTLARLPVRYGNRALPTIRVVDLAGVAFGKYYPFSPPLLEAMEQRIARKEQTVLFLNRRGVATAMLCLECRRRIVSQQTQLPFTVHRGADGRPYLLDHLSGVQAPIPSRCPQCGSTRLHAVGAGTQGLEESLSTLFPTARILRADADTLKKPEDIQELLRTMSNGEADILLGTQSVVKGLDLPGVTLAAVTVADIGLSLPHFRAGERVFQLLTQLAGRSGRAAPGEVIIQTFRPTAPEIIAASEHRTEDYLTAELELRHTLRYPPFSELIRFVFAEQRAEARARLLASSLKTAIEAKKADAVVSCAPTLLGGGTVWHVLLRGKQTQLLADAVDTAGATVDVDPIDLL